MSNEANQDLTQSFAAQDLDQALEAQSQALHVAQEKIDNTAYFLADGVVSCAVEIARGVSQAQPEVSKSLGREGIDALRRDVSNAAQQLAAELRAAPNTIEWPRFKKTSSTVTPSQVQTAIFNAWYGRRVNDIAEAIEAHGFKIRENRQDSQSVVLPQFLYDKDGLNIHIMEIIESQKAVARAEVAVKEAYDFIDKVAVDSLWD